MSELWAKWEGQVIDGGYPLRRLVGVSDHSGVFLTEAPAHNLPNAALKLVPAIPTLAELQLAHWNAAASLSHPRLLRLFAAGRCQLGNLHFLYVLMEYAEQNLAHLLENRALTEIEARETLPPILDGLGFLHSRNLVNGQLKPTNILVVGEQLKLASDTIRPADEAAATITMQSVYDPPESRDGSFSTAGDVWALGVTLYEALTRTLPARPDERSHGVILPADFPPASADVIKECLSRRPSDRPTVAALQAWIGGKVRYPGEPSSTNGGTAVDVARGAAAASGVDSMRGSPAAGNAAGGVGGTTDVGRGSSDSGAAMGGGGVARGTAAGAGALAAGIVGTAVDRRAASRDTVAESGAAVVSGADVSRGTPAGGGAAETAGGRGAYSVGSPAVRATQAAAATTVGVGFADRGSAGGFADVAVAEAAPAVKPSGASEPNASGANPGRLTIRAVVEREPIPEEQPASGPAYLPWVVVAIVAIALGWGVMHFLNSHSNGITSVPVAEAPQAVPVPPDASSAPLPAPVVAPPPPPAAESQQSADSNTTDSPDVVYQELPRVSPRSLSTIHGHLKVVVRVTVDPTGVVVEDNLSHPGPSHYFSRVASQSALKWKFVPSQQKDPREWWVHYDFSKSGVTARVTSGKP